MQLLSSLLAFIKEKVKARLSILLAGEQASQEIGSHALFGTKWDSGEKYKIGLLFSTVTFSHPQAPCRTSGESVIAFVVNMTSFAMNDVLSSDLDNNHILNFVDILNLKVSPKKPSDVNWKENEYFYPSTNESARLKEEADKWKQQLFAAEGVIWEQNRKLNFKEFEKQQLIQRIDQERINMERYTDMLRQGYVKATQEKDQRLKALWEEEERSALKMKMLRLENCNLRQVSTERYKNLRKAAKMITDLSYNGKKMEKKVDELIRARESTARSHHNTVNQMQMEIAGLKNERERFAGIIEEKNHKLSLMKLQISAKNKALATQEVNMKLVKRGKLSTEKKLIETSKKLEVINAHFTMTMRKHEQDFELRTLSCTDGGMGSNGDGELVDGKGLQRNFIEMANLVRENLRQQEARVHR